MADRALPPSDRDDDSTEVPDSTIELQRRMNAHSSAVQETARMKPPSVPPTDEGAYLLALQTLFGHAHVRDCGAYTLAGVSTPGRVDDAMAADLFLAKVVLPPRVQAAVRSQTHCVGAHWIGASFNTDGTLLVEITLRSHPDHKPSYEEALAIASEVLVLEIAAEGNRSDR